MKLKWMKSMKSSTFNERNCIAQAYKLLRPICEWLKRSGYHDCRRVDMTGFVVHMHNYKQEHERLHVWARCSLVSLTQLLFVSGTVVVVVATSIFKFTYGISARRAEAGSSDVNEHT